MMFKLERLLLKLNMKRKKIMTNEESAKIQSAGPSTVNEESTAVDLWAEIWRLRETVKGPDGYASWQDADTAERIRRVKAERALAAAPTSSPMPSKSKPTLDYDSLVLDFTSKWSGAQQVEAGDILEWIMGRPLAAAPAGVAAPEPSIDVFEATFPDHIWLDVGEDAKMEIAPGDTFHDLHEVTWSEDNASGYGVKYVRAAD